MPEAASSEPILVKVSERLTVRVACEGEVALSDIIVELMISTGRKNPYHLYFPKTDHNGMATLTRDEIVGQFADHWEAALMDHSGTLEEASPLVRVRLYDPTWSVANPCTALAWPLMKHERTIWSTREEGRRYRISSRNAEFVASVIEVDVEKTSNIVLTLERCMRGEGSIIPSGSSE